LQLLQWYWVETLVLGEWAELKRRNPKNATVCLSEIAVQKFFGNVE
jgi:hypothetical protein